jgi:hypothetical protein
MQNIEFQGIEFRTQSDHPATGIKSISSDCDTVTLCTLSSLRCADESKLFTKEIHQYVSAFASCYQQTSRSTVP